MKGQCMTLNRVGRPAADPLDVCCEIYNPGREEITFRSFHPERDLHWFSGRPPTHWAEIHCRPGEWCFLPHQYYTGTVPSGSAEIQVVKNFGDRMFIGEKHPSPPEVRKVQFRGSAV